MEEKKEWYVVNTYAGHENRVKENLLKRIESMDISQNLFRILVAEEEEIEIKNDKPVKVLKNLYPGYLFVEMIMTDESWYVVRNTPGVTGFIGSSGGGAKPFPVSKEEIENILRRIGHKDAKVNIDFKVEDTVKILNGSFANTEGIVESIDKENQKVVVNIFFLGRETPVEVGFIDVKKV